MSIATEIQRIKANIENAYTKAEEKGATIPTTKNSENLATTIESIPENSEVVINTQEKTATPSKSTQDVTPDSGYYLSKVVVNPIPDEYIVPSGSQDITANGTYDVTENKTANVNVPIPDGYIIPTGTQDITENGTYDITDKAQVVVNVASSGGSSENTLKKLLDYTKSMESMFSTRVVSFRTSDFFSFSDTSNVTTMQYTFNQCTGIYEISGIDTSKVTNMNNMCYRATYLQKALFNDTSKVTNLKSAFYLCSYLSEVSFNDTSSVTDITSLFYQCERLTTVSGLNMKNITSKSSIFAGCINLRNLEVLNIKISFQFGSTTYGTYLSKTSLIGLCQQCVNVDASRTLTIGSTNVSKLDGVYVKLTGEAEEDETLPKIPMVQCESTDEGAMTISDYMSLKNWSLA